MPSSKFVVNCKTSKTFRSEKVKGMFDCQFDEVEKKFDVNIPIEEINWNIGLIIGASGSGKTTIAKNLFEDFDLFEGFEWNGDCIIDDFDEKFSAKQITEILSKVGFSSPPDWLKPFKVLSNGQKMRAELARLILESDKPFVYDEFTSLVDRQVACIGSSAIQKFVRKQNKQFIAVSCHYDIEEWLEPDWVFDCNKMSFYRRRLRRPKIECKIRKAKQSEWKQFMEFHYLTHNHNVSAHKYICEINEYPVAWCSVLHFPHPKTDKIKKIHRIVVKPDYQGIGIGTRFLNFIASKYKDEKFKMTLVTSTPSFIHGLMKDKNWVMTRKPSRTPKKGKRSSLSIRSSSDRLTASFQFVDNFRGI